MKYKTYKYKTNQTGFIHWSIVVPLLVIILIGAVGYRVIGRGHAATVAPTGTYTTSTLPTTTAGYTDYSWDVTPRTDPSPDGYFWANQFFFEGGNGGYFGIQTEGSNPTGKIAVFSIWDSLSATGPQVVAPFSNEGTGYSVRISYNWAVNHTYHLQLISAGGGNWATYITDASSGIKSYVGQITVPSTWGGLTNSADMWTERYSGPLTSCADLLHSVVDFANLRANNGTILPTGHSNQVDTSNTCPNSQLEGITGGVRQELGTGDAPTWTDTMPPTTPRNVTAVAVSSSQINVSWTVSSDDSAIASYKVFRKGVAIAQPAATTYRDSGLVPSTTYSYTVQAVDSYGNVSSSSSIAKATTLKNSGYRH